MNKRVAILLSLVSCLTSLMVAQPVRAADLGTRYSDAFVLIQQGQAAEEKSDLPTAYYKYQDALNVLHGIHTDSPDWNTQMVEYRLKDCQSRFDAVKTKLPDPPPAPPVEAAPVAAPSVPVPVVEPVAPVPVAEDQSVKLNAQIDPLQKENNDLKSKLATADKQTATVKPADTAQLKKLRADADSAKKEASDLERKNADLSNQVAAANRSTSQIANLQKQNHDLNEQLATAKKEASAKVTPPAPVPVPVAVTDNAQLKKLRADADSARAEADKEKKAASDLEKKNAELNSQVVAARKQATDSADAKSAELKKLHADLDKARADADVAKKSTSQVTDLQKQNQELSAQLASAKKSASTKVTPPVAVPVGDSAELKKLRTDADTARAEADKEKKTASDLEKKNTDLNSQLVAAKKSGSQVADLQKQNQDLNAKLVAVEKKANIQPTDSAEVKNLRTDLDKSHTEIADLKKQVAAKPTGDTTEVKNLRSQLADSQKALDQARKSANQVADLEKQNKDLSAQLVTAKKEASAKVTPVAAPAGDGVEVKALRQQLDAARVDANKGKQASVRLAELEKQNADLYAKLATEKKATSIAIAAEPTDARVMKNLRNENSYLRNLLDTYAADNSELKGQLHRHDLSQQKSYE